MEELSCIWRVSRGMHSNRKCLSLRDVSPLGVVGIDDGLLRMGHLSVDSYCTVSRLANSVVRIPLILKQF